MHSPSPIATASVHLPVRLDWLDRRRAGTACFTLWRARGGIFWRAGRPRFDKFSCVISAN